MRQLWDTREGLKPNANNDRTIGWGMEMQELGSGKLGGRNEG